MTKFAVLRRAIDRAEQKRRWNDGRERLQRLERLIELQVLLPSAFSSQPSSSL